MIVHHYYETDSRVRRYAETLTHAGHRVDVICLRDPNKSDKKSNNGIRVYPIPLSRSYAGLASYLMEYGVAFTLYSLWLFFLMLKNRYQIIHAHNMPDFLVFTSLLPRLFKARIILDIHDPMPEFFMSKYHKTEASLITRLMKLQEKLSSRYAHAVITANNNFKKNLIQRGLPPDKITVVNNLPDPKVFKRTTNIRNAPDKKEYFTMIYPGTIEPRYGLDIAIKALPRIVEKIPNIRLLLIGHKRGYVDELAALAKRLDVTPLVTFSDTIPIESVSEQLVRADVGIYPALPDPHMEIATPSKVMEFAFMGLPIVASRIKVLEDVFDDSAILFFEPGDVAQFAECIIRLHENPSGRQALVENMDRAFISKYSWDREAHKYFLLIERLASQ
jgi:glycosyltransferase involved in cell wall biosynthesis